MAQKILLYIDKLLHELSPSVVFCHHLDLQYRHISLHFYMAHKYRKFYTGIEVPESPRRIRIVEWLSFLFHFVSRKLCHSGKCIFHSNKAHQHRHTDYKLYLRIALDIDKQEYYRQFRMYPHLDISRYYIQYGQSRIGVPQIHLGKYI